jgi:nucleotide-binding universal stress UspA family protein
MDRKMRILIGTDGSDFSKYAVEKACEFIRPNKTEVLCLSTYENPVTTAIDPAFTSNTYYQSLVEALAVGAENNVQNAEKQIRTHFSPNEVPVRTQVLNGYADNLLLEKAKDWGADLIIVGSHGRGFWGRLLGSVSNGVVHHAPCSVLVAKKPAVE